MYSGVEGENLVTSRTHSNDSNGSSHPSYLFYGCFIDVRLKNFWWGFDNDNKHNFHPKTWSVICTPKVRGGLGLRNMADLNRALLAKLGWRFLTQKHLLWVQELEAKYCRNSNFLSVPNQGEPLGFGEAYCR